MVTMLLQHSPKKIFYFKAKIKVNKYNCNGNDELLIPHCTKNQ